MRYKRFYLGIVSILVILGLAAQYVEYYDNYEDVVVCGEECWVEFCMKNKGHNLYFYNKEELPLTFSDNSVITGVEFFKKDGRFKTGFRPIDFITPYTKGRLYVFKIPAYSYTCYGMKIYKESSATVKWTFLGLDPILQAPDANLTYELNSNLIENISQNFRPDWSVILDLVNFSNSTILNSGNYSWNFSQYNISTNITDWDYNFTNNESTSNLTLWATLNQSFDNLVVWFYLNSTQRFNITNASYTDITNISVNNSQLMNITIDLINISQTYVNWTNTYDNTNFNFNVTFNVTTN